MAFGIASHSDAFAQVEVRWQLQEILHRVVRNIRCGFERLGTSRRILLCKCRHAKKQNNCNLKESFSLSHSRLQNMSEEAVDLCRPTACQRTHSEIHLHAKLPWSSVLPVPLYVGTSHSRA